MDGLQTNIWFVLTTWSILYLALACLMLMLERENRSGGAAYFSVEGDRATASNQRATLETYLLSYLAYWVISLVFLWMVWKLAIQTRASWAYEAILGGLYLFIAMLVMQAVQNLATMRLARAPQSMRGQLHYSPRMRRWLSAVHMAIFAAFCLATALWLSSWFFLGGSVVIAAGAIYQWIKSLKAPLLPPDEASGAPAASAPAANDLERSS